MLDQLAIVEAGYRLDLSDTDCLHQIAYASDALDARRGLLVFATKLRSYPGDDIDAELEIVTRRARPGQIKALQETVARSSRADQRDVMFLTAAYTSMSEMQPLTPSLPVARTHGLGDLTGLNCPTGTGHCVTIAAIQDERRRTTAKERQRWAPVAAHLAASWRLRKRLSPDLLDEVARFAR